MRSGNGRHRRPRQAPAIVVAAGVTGSAIALPLLGAGSASAADATTWDRVAECESGGLWSADLGNGFYGGLQMSQETWESYGGLAHAPRPDLASRAEQMAVADKVYAATGVEAWETCAPVAGLGGTTSAPGADSTGTAPAATDPAEILEDPGTPAASDPAIPADPTGTPRPTDPATASQSPAPGTGKHRGEPAKEEAAVTDPAAPADPTAPAAPADPTAPLTPGAPEGGGTLEPTGPADTGNSVTDREKDAHASRGDGATRDPGSVAPGAYTVRPGDSLSVIADEHEVPGGWSALYEANQDTVGADPDLILPGQSLELTADQPKE
ncbi:transglycosylase family protein [Streptomyces lavendulocolor]|uniref:Transglycosylase family protein n=1 Tax=Streptomyces lavendulocolor TaxID=67316 RepID=A0ABV2W1Y5_9ACTN